MSILTTHDHSRDSAGLTYVYPVFSRRSGGLSIGINLNPNNACNWRCIYCQVPNLVRGRAPELDLFVLENELRGLLENVQTGDFFDRYQLEEGQRVIRDIAISGNGEPTSSEDFPKVVAIIGQLAAEFGLLGRIALVLISNGSLMDKPKVLQGLAHWAELGGQVWFKLDRATTPGMAEINQVHLTPETVMKHLQQCAAYCPTWIQSCWFKIDETLPSEAEKVAFLDFLKASRERDVHLQGILLYGLARPSMQAEASRLSPVTDAWLKEFSGEIESLGFKVRVSG